MGGLWAVTCYFNPAGYQRKRDNYRAFRQHLRVPLVAVELTFDGHYHLGPDDADIVVRVEGGDVLWQKERLLNVGIEALPAECDVVAWLDCDVVFESARWPRELREALDRFDLVQLFHERHNLPPDVPVEGLSDWDRPASAMSFVHKFALGAATHGDLVRNNAQLELGSTAGLAWASRRELLDRHRLYDACILGGGDRVMLCAGLGELTAGCLTQHMNGRRAAHYLAWARPFCESVAGRVGCIPGRLFHLWHGDLRDRRYESRLAHLADFDPFTDIAVGAGGAWRWSSDKPKLHAAVREYFAQRNEDGDDPVVGVEAMAIARQRT